MSTFDSPEDAYNAFFHAFNRQDAQAWAAVMHYPHVRVAPPREGLATRTAARFYPTPDDYAAAVSWEPFKAQGWVRTEGIEPRRVLETERLVVLAGGWARYNADGEPYLRNRVCYIITRPDGGDNSRGGWGIQARFGIDTWQHDGGGADTAESERAAREVAQQLPRLGSNGDADGVLRLTHLPFTFVSPGDAVQLATADQVREFVPASGPDWASIETETVQAGRTAVNVLRTARDRDGAAYTDLLSITRRDGVWAQSGLVWTGQSG